MGERDGIIRLALHPQDQEYNYDAVSYYVQVSCMVDGKKVFHSAHLFNDAIIYLNVNSINTVTDCKIEGVGFEDDTIWAEDGESWDYVWHKESPYVKRTQNKEITFTWTNPETPIQLVKRQVRFIDAYPIKEEADNIKGIRLQMRDGKPLTRAISDFEINYKRSSVLGDLVDNTLSPDKTLFLNKTSIDILFPVETYKIKKCRLSALVLHQDDISAHNYSWRGNYDSEDIDRNGVKGKGFLDEVYLVDYSEKDTNSESVEYQS